MRYFIIYYFYIGSPLASFGRAWKTHTGNEYPNAATLEEHISKANSGAVISITGITELSEQDFKSFTA